MIRKEVGVFLVVGSLTVVVDYIVYQVALWSGMATSPAKGIGFVAGTIFAYFTNRVWTFGHRRAVVGSVYRFIVLYAMTLAANVAINAYVLTVFEPHPWAVHIAFFLATGVSAMLNFLGMKFFVFHEAREGKGIA